MKTTKSNLLVGSTVLFDYPAFRADDSASQAAKDYNLAEIQRRPHYGKTGIVMATDTIEGCKELTVRLTTGELVKAMIHFVSVTELPKPDRTEELLEAILSKLNDIYLDHGHS